jgi:hypothetical protein
MPDSIIWRGLAELEAAFVEKAAAAQAATRNAVVEAAHLAEASMKEHAGEGGRHQKGTPTPASPGGGPAVITGSLRRSITVGAITPWGIGGWQTKVGPTAVYGRRVELEFGYPYTRPGLEAITPALPAIFARNWAGAIR